MEIISFGEDDTLYILGDIVDRGPDSIKLVLDLAGRKNVIVLRGNHDDTAYRLLKYLDMPWNGQNEDKLADIYRLWISDGGYATLNGYQKLNDTDKKKVLSFLRSLPLYEELTVNGQRFFLSHTVPEKEKMRDFDSCKMTDLIMGEPEYEKVYFPDRYLVTGHTPTGFIDEAYTGRIRQKNNHIAIDCGAVFGNPLGCICLDNSEEYYANE